MKISDTRFADYDCIQLQNDSIVLCVTVTVGPRILNLQLKDNENLMALLPEAVAETPAGRRYWLRGGHRLWHAPEDPERTYVPDDSPLDVEQIARGIQLTQPVEKETGIQKQLKVCLPDESASVQVDHRLANLSMWPVTLAPWAITQLRPGGYGILPQATHNTGLLPNRRLALWPYTEIGARYLQWGDRFILIYAAMERGKLKLGWNNPAGWLGYWSDGVLFVKATEYRPEAEYLDYGSSSECYCDPRFIELETIGPVVTLPPGESVTHREIWRIFPLEHFNPDEASIAETMATLGIVCRGSGS